MDIEINYFSFEVVAYGYIALLHQIIDHALKTHGPPIIGCVYPRNTISHQFLNFFRKDDPASPTKYFDVSSTTLLKQIIHIFKILHMTALIRRHGDSVNVFLNGRIYHLIYTTIMTKVDHFNSGTLDDAPHDIDGGVVAIKKRGSGNDTYFMLRQVRFWLLHW